MLRQVLVREFSSLSEACFRDFQRAAAEPWDFRRYPAGICDISTLNSPQVVRNGSVGVYIYIFYISIHVYIYIELVHTLKNFKLHFALNFDGIAVIPLPLS